MSFEKKTLSENNLSNMMNSFYNAIIQSDVNLNLLLTEDPWEISPKDFGGNLDAKLHMDNFCEFLETIKIIAKDEETYINQFLKPVQLVVKNLIEIRNMKIITADTDGWIFAKSRTSKIKSKEKNTVSAVFPQLQTAMSVSINKDDLSKTVPEYHQFKMSQPIGLINRVHQTRTRIEIQQKAVLLSEFDFLFTAFTDIENMGNSIEMENFCEIDSIQSKVKTHMGRPFVSFAMVLSSRGPKITLKPLGNDQKSQKFTLSNHYFNNGGTDPKELHGKYVRFFGVAWYNSGYINDIDFEKSEIFLMQEEKDVHRLRFEDVLGHIRLRSNTTVKEAEKLLNQKMNSDENIEIVGELVKFRYKISNNSIHARFVETTNEIRKIREKYKISSPILSQNQVIDPDKRSLHTWTQIIKSTKLKILYHILLNIQIQIDVKGSTQISTIVSKTQQMFTEEMVKRKFRWLKKLGFVEDDPTIKITNAGTHILALACKEELDNMTFKSQEIVKIENIEKYGIPTSIFQKYMKNMTEFHPLRLDEKMETRLIWTKKDNSETNEEIKIDYLNKRNKILDIMRSVRHPLTTEQISLECEKSNEHLGNFVVGQYLLEIREAGIVREDAGSWEYPIHSRMFDLFKVFPNEFFDVETICEKCTISFLENKEKVKDYLLQFKQKEIVVIINGKWTSSEEEARKKQESKKNQIREMALSVLRNVIQIPKTDTVSDKYWQKPPPENDLGDEFVSKISKKYYQQNQELVSDEIIKDEIDLMIQEGIIKQRQ